VESLANPSTQFHDRPINHLLNAPNLERVQRRGSDRWAASCPCSDHPRGDRSRGLSIRELPDGQVLLNCFAGHSAFDVVDALGLSIEDLFPPRTERPFRPLRPQPEPLPRSIAEVLYEVAELPQNLEAVKEMAKLDPALMKQDVVNSWGWLSERFDVPALLKLAYLLRGVALFRYGDKHKCEDPMHISRCVDRLVSELST
jgi:hypothetical protein